jgi:sec-independent protein translocase protein TatA
MFGIGWPELIIVFLIVLVVFGAGRLPEIGAGLGKGIINFKKAIYDTEKAIQSGAAEAKPQDKDKEKPV